jgi:hypothetical protein
MEFQPLLGSVAGKPEQAVNNESLTKPGTLGSAYMHGAIVEM